ncbi:UDP-glucose/GDP-mannose dehydrogenase family protein [Candidatus Pacearchaeota archaeon]|nr:UDP-glucose/GDP-mannose dehydrogenase family protein [Candidatus Pacearchaeota archaeon]
MKIGIIGAGVVGKATGEILVKAHEVFYFDRYKKEFDEIEKIAKEAEVVFICVPTPMKLSGEIDYSAIYHSLSYLLQNVYKAARNPHNIIVVIRSTAVSGTTDKFAEEFPFKFAFNPEFLREKHAAEDMENTNRIVIGTNERDVEVKLTSLYKDIFPDAKYIYVDIKTAEMIKYSANVFLASQVAIANEIYNICKALGIDYDTVKNAILHDNRVARNIDVPGHDGDFGFGGKCLAKDINALIYLARENHYRPYLLEEVWRLNENVRKNKDWLDIPGATSEGKKFKEKD